jgi:hypothetical protein
MRLSNFFTASALTLAITLAPLLAQINNVLTITPPEKIAGAPNQIVTASFRLELKPGYHVNSNTPADEYMIPMKFTSSGNAAELVEVVFPKPTIEKYSFSEKPLSVFTGDFKLLAKFKISGNAGNGPNVVNGKLRYQACNDKACLPPRTLEVKVPVVVRN